jgi:chemotaxis signal transduction protein
MQRDIYGDIFDSFDEFDDEFYDQNDEPLNQHSKQYFYFLSNKTTYAIEASDVLEILEYQNITQVPLLHSYIHGITNIRGDIVGVVDILNRFENRTTIICNKTAIVVISILNNNKSHKIALLVDEIFEVDGLDENSIKEVPSFGTKIKKTYIKNLAKYNNKEVYILNLETILNFEELSQLNNNIQEEDASLYQREVIYKDRTFLDQEDEFEEDEFDEDEELDIMNVISNDIQNINQYLIYEGPNQQYYAKNVSKIEEVIDIKDFKIQKNFDENIIFGTINLRGEIISIINFDRWLGLKDIVESDYEEIIIVNLTQHKFGIIVRQTHDIINIDSNMMTKSNEADAKSTFITQIELNNSEVLCTIVDSDQIVMDISYDKEKQNELEISNIQEHINTTKTVLFADDSTLIRNMLQKIAQKLKLNYKIFENGKQLLKYLEDTNLEDIGLIVTDLEMPKMDGKELITKIRQNKRFDNINIIVYTNMANKILKDELKNIGANKVVTKIDNKNLSKAIKKFIE